MTSKMYWPCKDETNCIRYFKSLIVRVGMFNICQTILQSTKNYTKLIMFHYEMVSHTVAR